MIKYNPKISCCIITDNNPDVINAIKSVYKSCFEIILVNTVDEFTIDLTGLDKVKLFQFKWCNDFSKARNYGIDKASGEWILIIDSDEVLNDEIQYLDDTYKAYQCIQRNGNSDYWTNRLFKNIPEHRYINSVHETIDHALNSNDIVQSDIILIHNGFEISEEEMKLKIKRNYDIMFKDYGNVIRNLHLGNYEYLYNEDYRKALEYYTDALSDKLNDPHYAIIHYNIFACKSSLGYPIDDRIKSLRKSIFYEPFQLQAYVQLLELLNPGSKEAINIFNKIKNIYENNLSELQIPDVQLDEKYFEVKSKQLKL